MKGVNVVVSRILLILALLLAASAGFLALQPADGPVPPFTVEPLELDLGPTATGTRTLTYRITNPANVPRRIIGLAEG